MQSQSCRSLARGVSKSRGLTKATTLRWRRDLATAVDSAQRDPTEFDEISTLSNGVRVATEALPGPFSGIGVYIDAGSRYEDEELRGVSHIIDRLSFKSTKTRSSDEIAKAIESLGGNMQCASSRESLMYQAASFNSSVSTTLGVLAETIRDPQITDSEVQQELESAEYEIGEIWSKPEMILPEVVHLAAYKDNTLGNPLLCPQDRLRFINKNIVEKYMNTFYRPERLVVAFAGVSHEEASKITEKYFGDMQNKNGRQLSGIGLDTYPTKESRDSSSTSSSVTSSHSSQTTSLSSSSPQASRLLSKIPFFKNLSTSAPNHASVSSMNPDALQASVSSHYTGGFLSLPAIPPPPNPALPRLSYIHLAFEALPIFSEDIYALAALQTLLGGGGSFSAGGPGKGMYSRLYTNVLNQNSWVESCIAFNHSYTDSGLFGISASCSPSHVKSMLDVMCKELTNLTLDSGYLALQAGEVQRAKNQLRSSLLMNLESRMVELEDLGRQVQVHGRKVGVKEMCRKIDELTIQDLRRVAKRVFEGKIQNVGNGSGAPTVVLQEGDEEGVSRKDFEWVEIQERIGRWKLGRR
ncbi:Mitochondrial-processing peptidase subunit alpha [Varicellaria rhodocarpa]|nr:Mitochondrial-processing peptidase subunit alpha [Varicellaria rhodocarpa]